MTDFQNLNEAPNREEGDSSPETLKGNTQRTVWTQRPHTLRAKDERARHGILNRKKQETSCGN